MEVNLKSFTFLELVERVQELEQELQAIQKILVELKTQNPEVENSPFLTLEELKISQEEANQTAQKFATFAEDWNKEDMDIYDQVYAPIIREELKNQNSENQQSDV